MAENIVRQNLVNENIIFVFPGQGNQYVGMGADLFKEYASVRHVYEEVSDATGLNVYDISNGSENNFKDTLNIQLATFTHSAAVLTALRDELGLKAGETVHAATVGHSMGEYASLFAAGSLKLKDAAYMLKHRAKRMVDASKDGTVGVVVGLEKPVVEELIASAQDTGYVAIANYNEPTQFSFSGNIAAVEHVAKAAQERGARVARRLDIPVAAHCALMEPARQAWHEDVKNIMPESPKVKIGWFSNESADLIYMPTEIKKALENQLIHGIRWWEIMQKFPLYNITRAYELGPGKSLTKMINRANVGTTAASVQTVADVKMTAEDIGTIMAHRASFDR